MATEKENTKAVAAMSDFNALSMYFDGTQFGLAQRVCNMLACSDLVPKEYQYKPINYLNADGTVNPALKAQDDAARSKAIANCMIALNKAATLKTDPLTIMQNMTPVYGKPSWSATFLIGTVNTCGRFMPLKFRFGEDGVINETYTVYKKNGGGVQKTINMPNLTCVAYTTERGSDEILEGTEISLRMAFEENWIQKDGSKWLTMPKQMLMYRAAAFWVRVYAPEISQGMHTTEEVRDLAQVEDADFEDITEQKVLQNANQQELPPEEPAAAPQPKTVEAKAPEAPKAAAEMPSVFDI